MTTETLIRPDGTKLPYDRYPQSGDLGVVFFHGFKSDRNATKASYMVDACADLGLTLTKFDAFAHGQSDGDWADFTIGRAVADALLVLDTLTRGPQILVGSSMGGWMALNIMLKRPDKVAGIVGVAAAPDFTQWVERDSTPTERAAEGFTDALLAEAKNQFVMDKPAADKPWPWQGPVHLLQGLADADVPWQTAEAIKAKFANPYNITVTLIPEGDHRLNRPEDLQALKDAIKDVKSRI